MKYPKKFDHWIILFCLLIFILIVIMFFYNRLEAKNDGPSEVLDKVIESKILKNNMGYTKNEQSVYLYILDLEISQAHFPSDIYSLDFHNFFKKTVIDAGYDCNVAEIVFLNNASLSWFLLQKNMIARGYKFVSVKPIVGENSAWLLRHQTENDFYLTYSEDENNRGNINICKLLD